MGKRQDLMINDSDMDLVSRAIGGDERSFEILIEKYYLSVYQLYFRWCRVKGGKKKGCL